MIHEEQQAQEEPEDVDPKALEELDRFREALVPFYNRYMLHVARVDDPASPSHPERMREIGRHCRDIRKRAGLSRNDAAKRIGIDPVLYAAFEGGMVPPADLPSNFPAKLAAVLTEARQNVEEEK